MKDKPYPQCKHDAVTLSELQALPLKRKVFLTRLRIAEWYEYWEGKAYVAFSGGKDSTVLLDLVRRDYPDVPAVFCDTGLEYPEVRDFVKTIDNVVWLKPKITFRTVLKKYGYPVISKRQAQYIREARHTKSEVLRALRITGKRKNGELSRYSKISDKWQFLIHAPFEVSEQCCDVMKKRPSKEYTKETGRVPFLGTMASDSKNRELNYIQNGCNAYQNSNQLTSAPLSFWHTSDVWEYIRSRDLPYSEIYNMGYMRTGCVFCMFGAHMNCPNRFQRMEKTHPKLHKYCMNTLGMREVLEYCGIPWKNRQMELDLGPGF